MPSKLTGLKWLVTGATGSFGQAFARYVYDNLSPSTIRCFSRDEEKQRLMRQTLDDSNISYLLGDVRDRERLMLASQDIDVIVHAAALKQVPALEYNPEEAIKTNIQGSMNVAAAALANKVPRTIGLSSDKAAGAVNLYGSTKFCMEKIFGAYASYSGAHDIRFACTRYGNVAGSTGSVVPLFQAQAAAGKPLTITHPEMTRFWLTLLDGAKFVLRALEDMQGGEVFVPKIPSFHIADLATAISDNTVIIGIREGEKLHESLITVDEGPISWDTSDYYIISRTAPGVRNQPGFRYRSDLNSEWLSTDHLRELLKTL
jgi:FlaA1/EpsC-like NDP-sugar epimerase